MGSLYWIKSQPQPIRISLVKGHTTEQTTEEFLSEFYDFAAYRENSCPTTPFASGKALGIFVVERDDRMGVVCPCGNLCGKRWYRILHPEHGRAFLHLLLANHELVRVKEDNDDGLDPETEE